MLDHEKSLIFLRDSEASETRERTRENCLLRVDAHANRIGKRKINFSSFPGGDFAHSHVYLALLSVNIYQGTIHSLVQCHLPILTLRYYENCSVCGATVIPGVYFIILQSHWHAL